MSEASNPPHEPTIDNAEDAALFDRLRRRVYLLLDVGAGGRHGYWFDAFIMGLIVANVFAVALETVGSVYVDFERAFFVFEVVSVLIFSVEYLGRLWVAPEHPEYDHPIRGRIRFAASPFMLIDLLAILPFFIGFVVDLRSLRAVRLARFLRLFKLARYSASLRAFVHVLRRKREDLVIAVSGGMILLLVASTLMYFAERTAQPETFASIPASLWWGVITLTTVGYGDVYPITPAGKLLGAFVAIIGIGLFALPASILASGFVEEASTVPKRCPHCGESIEDEY
jgi:voltage-gated potassium channel